ncbi:hypothetical protein D9M68_838850 [compost metagenome]
MPAQNCLAAEAVLQQQHLAARSQRRGQLWRQLFIGGGFAGNDQPVAWLQRLDIGVDIHRVQGDRSLLPTDQAQTLLGNRLKIAAHYKVHVVACACQ